MRKRGVTIIESLLYVAILTAVVTVCASRTQAAGFVQYRLNGTPSFTDDMRHVPKAATEVQQGFEPRELRRTPVFRVPNYQRHIVDEPVVVMPPELRGSFENPSYYIQMPHYPTCHHDYRLVTNPLEQPWHTCDPE